MPTQHELAKLGSEPRSVCAQGTGACNPHFCPYVARRGAAQESQVSAVAVLDQNMPRGYPWLLNESKEEEQVLPKKGEEERVKEICFGGLKLWP